MKDTKTFEIYRCYTNGKVAKNPIVLVKGKDEKSAWLSFGKTELYLNYPETTSFTAKEVDTDEKVVVERF